MKISIQFFGDFKKNVHMTIKINFSISKWFQSGISEQSQGPSYVTMKVHTRNTA